MTGDKTGSPRNVGFPEFAAEMLAESDECAHEPRLLAGLYRSYRRAAQNAGLDWAKELSVDADVEAWYAST